MLCEVAYIRYKTKLIWLYTNNIEVKYGESAYCYAFAADLLDSSSRKLNALVDFVKNISNKSRIFAINLGGLPICLRIECRCGKAFAEIFQNCFN